MENPLKINYKIFLEAEDVSQSRIRACAADLKHTLEAHGNPYIRRAGVDDESDKDDFILRLYVDECIAEDDASDADAAEAFLDELAELLSEFAGRNSFLEMEGSFSVSFRGEEIAYTFASGENEAQLLFQEV